MPTRCDTREVRFQIYKLPHHLISCKYSVLLHEKYSYQQAGWCILYNNYYPALTNHLQILRARFDIEFYLPVPILMILFAALVSGTTVTLCFALNKRGVNI